MILSFVDLGVLLAQKAKDLGAGVTNGVSNVMSATKSAFIGETAKDTNDKQSTQVFHTDDKVIRGKQYHKLKALIEAHHLKLRDINKRNAIKIQYMASDIKTMHYIFANIRITTEISNHTSLGFGDKLLKLKFNLQFKPVNNDVKYSFCNVQIIFRKDKMTMMFSAEQPDIDISKGTVMHDISVGDIEYLFGNRNNHKHKVLNFTLHLSDAEMQYIQDIIDVMAEDIDARRTEDYSLAIDSILASLMGKVFTFWQRGISKDTKQYSQLFVDNIYLVLFACAIKQLQQIYC